MLFNWSIDIPAATSTSSKQSMSSDNDDQHDEPSEEMRYDLNAESGGHPEGVQQPRDQAYAKAKYIAKNSLGSICILKNRELCIQSVSSNRKPTR